jgi:predicted AlkP superfamily pyrophosphatase or phosphodiesterase
MPGRSSIVTGVSSAENGVYGNKLLDNTEFRYAHPYDVRTPTLAKYAMDAGLEVASIGYGMIKPEDTSVFVPAFWIRDFIQRGRDARRLAIHSDWQRALKIVDPKQRMDDLFERGYPRALPNDRRAAMSHRWITEVANDFVIMQWVIGLATSAAPPDLIFTEINITDGVQHAMGYASEEADWAIRSADAMVGSLMNALQHHGRDEYALCVVSDHGHGPIDTALYADRLVPNHAWESEGSMLHVAANAGQQDELIVRFAEHDATPWPQDYLPRDVRDRLITFAAPARTSFEHSGWSGDSESVCQHALSGRPAAISSHGRPPGSSEDDRLCVIAGAGVANGVIDHAPAEALAPTIGALLNLNPDLWATAPWAAVSNRT